MRDKKWTLFLLAMIPVSIGVFMVPQMFVEYPVVDLWFMTRLIVSGAMLMSIFLLLTWGDEKTR